jgi:Protein of unknown function (DUF2752)
VQPEHTDMDHKDDLPLAKLATGVPRTGLIVRLVLLLIAASLACVFGVAFWLNPYEPDGTPRRMATHTQLGAPPCNFLLTTGKPCPACGMTTSFALLVRGDVAASLRANWAGTIIAVLWAFTMVWAVMSGIKGRTLFIPRGKVEIVLTIAVGIVLALMLIRWVGVLIWGL